MPKKATGEPVLLPIAETAMADVDVAAPARHALPPGGSSEFLSAFVALDLKPPTL